MQTLELEREELEEINVKVAAVETLMGSIPEAVDLLIQLDDKLKYYGDYSAAVKKSLKAVSASTGIETFQGTKGGEVKIYSEERLKIETNDLITYLQQSDKINLLPYLVSVLVTAARKVLTDEVAEKIGYFDDPIVKLKITKRGG
jgi:hypothetical protein